MIESDSASRRDDGSAFGWASRCGVVRESTKEAVDSDEMPGPPSTRERKAVLYTRKQLEVLQRRADEQVSFSRRAPLVLIQAVSRARGSGS